MKDVRITVIRKVSHDDLIAKYENPISHAREMKENEVFVSHGHQMPDGFCASAWESISPFVLTLSCNGADIFDGWMKNPTTAMISCNDGFRPVSFLLETCIG